MGQGTPFSGRDYISPPLTLISSAKFQLALGEQEDLIADYIPWCETIMVTHPPSVPSCRDPSDRPFLELALKGLADALVTGDGDLLPLAPVFAIPILTPHAAKGRWGPGSTERNA